MEDQTEQVSGFMSQVSGANVQFGPGFAGMVTAEGALTMERAGALVVRAGENMEMSYGGATALVAGGDMHVEQGGGQVLVVGGDLDIHTGGAQFAIAGGEVNATHSTLGLVFARQVTVSEDSKVLFNTPQAVVFGLAFGAAYALMNRLFFRRRRRR
jgi:hypothetical protein